MVVWSKVRTGERDEAKSLRSEVEREESLCHRPRVPFTTTDRSPSKFGPGAAPPSPVCMCKTYRRYTVVVVRKDEPYSSR